MRSRIQRRSDMCSLGVGLSRRSIQVLTEPNITVAPLISEVGMAARSSLDQRFVPFRKPNSHMTRTEHVQHEKYFSVRTEPATVMLSSPQYSSPQYRSCKAAL